MVLLIPSYRPHRAARAFVVVWRCRRIYLDLRQAAFLSVSHSVRGRTDGQLQNKKLTWGFWPFFRPLFLSKKQKKWHKRCTEMKWMPFFFAATPAQGKYEIAKMVCFDGAPLTPPFFWGKKKRLAASQRFIAKFNLTLHFVYISEWRHHQSKSENYPLQKVNANHCGAIQIPFNDFDFFFLLFFLNRPETLVTFPLLCLLCMCCVSLSLCVCVNIKSVKSVDHILWARSNPSTYISRKRECRTHHQSIISIGKRLLSIQIHFIWCIHVCLMIVKGRAFDC